MANVLGLQFGHDGAAAIVRDNRLVAAISNERLSRKKKAAGVTSEMIAYVLEAAKLKLSDIELVSVCSYVYNTENYVKVLSIDGQLIERHIIDLPTAQTHKVCKVRVGSFLLDGAVIQHHIAHCASAFYTSNFEQAACLSVDASMHRPEACSLYAYGIGRELFYLECPGVMIGNAYSVITEKLGIGSGLTKAGTTMALASFAEAESEIKDAWRDIAKNYYARSTQKDDALAIASLWSRISALPPHQTIPQSESDSEKAQQIAANLQYVFEEKLIEASDELYEKTRHYHGESLCLSGGSFLNSSANMAIRQRSQFKFYHLFPACGDDGTAAGAALFATHQLLGKEREDYHAGEIAFLGQEYPDPQGGEEFDAHVVAKAISEGKIVAYCRGRSEFGPRALGNRSILADPRNPEMKDSINQRVKHREWFRPFAPAVLQEYAEEWFEVDFESPFMLYIANAKKPDEIPAVMHVDATARLQTVCAEHNPDFHEIISAFHSITGVPILLNTSLNDNGEPLVETPEDAFNFFKKGNVDMLVVGNKIFHYDPALNET